MYRLKSSCVKWNFCYEFNLDCRVTRVIQARQLQPWLQIEWLFRLLPIASEQKRCLSILHGFTDQVCDFWTFKSHFKFTSLCIVFIVLMCRWFVKGKSTTNCERPRKRKRDRRKTTISLQVLLFKCIQSNLQCQLAAKRWYFYRHREITFGISWSFDRSLGRWESTQRSWHSWRSWHLHVWGIGGITR